MLGRQQLLLILLLLLPSIHMLSTCLPLPRALQLLGTIWPIWGKTVLEEVFFA